MDEPPSLEELIEKFPGKIITYHKGSVVVSETYWSPYSDVECLYKYEKVEEEETLK